MVGRERDPVHPDEPLGGTEQHVGPAGERMVVHVARDLHRDEPPEGREQPADGEDDEGGDEGGRLGLGPEELALDDQQREHAGADEQRDDVSGVDEVQREGGDEERHRHQPRAPLTLQDAAGQHDHADAGDRGQRARGLDDGNGQVLRDQVQVRPQRRRDRGEQVDGAGHEQRDGGDATDAAHPDAVRGHLGSGRPRGTTRPPGREFGVHLGRLRAALDHDVGGHQPLAHGGHGQVCLGQEQADVQVGPGLYLERRLLAVMEECRREPQPSPVLVDHLGGGARAGEEAGVEVGELGHECPADDHARRTGLDGGTRGVQGVLAVDLELCVRDRAAPGGAARPGCRQSVTPECSPDAPRGDRHHQGEHRQQHDGDDEGDDEAREPRRRVRARCSALCWRGERKMRPRPSITKSTRSNSAMAARARGGAHR